MMAIVLNYCFRFLLWHANTVSSVPCKSISMPISNGFRNGRIVGGVSATRASIPYIASLTRRGGHFCGKKINFLNVIYLLANIDCAC